MPFSPHAEPGISTRRLLLTIFHLAISSRPATDVAVFKTVDRRFVTHQSALIGCQPPKTGDGRT
jgi:hypothetical protein